jgi:hypothetical protein
MDELLSSLEAVPKYPKNLICHQVYPHVLDSYVSRLDEREQTLFCDKRKAAVDFWQFDHAGQGFWDKRVCNDVELREQLRIGVLPQRLDPRCQFMYVKNEKHSQIGMLS